MAEAIRVALLARPGAACEKLQAALQQAGADVVHVGDPTEGDTAAVSAAEPSAIVVALEPAIEPALDEFDAILHDPARIVIYDEAELAEQREGWDAARWSRHLVAKLAGHADVLPPGREEPDGHARPEPPVEATADAQAEASVEPETRASAPVNAASRAVTIEYSGGSLLDDIALAPMDGDDAQAVPSFAPETSTLPTPAASGGVVVLAGIGGPDAVRQFLGALPERFPRPVLVRQRLDGGRHDRLVTQLQRATPLPVELASAGVRLAPGHVYIMPDGMATEASDDGLRFAETGAAVGALAGLDAADSAVLLLSGADATLVDEVIGLADTGTLVAGQSPEECFDNAAPGAAIARGADSGSPAQLAERLASRWTP